MTELTKLSFKIPFGDIAFICGRKLLCKAVNSQSHHFKLYLVIFSACDFTVNS